MELWIQIEEKNKLLDRAINDLAKNGYDLAENHHNAVADAEACAVIAMNIF